MLAIMTSDGTDSQHHPFATGTEITSNLISTETITHDEDALDRSVIYHLFEIVADDLFPQREHRHPREYRAGIGRVCGPILDQSCRS